jgi:hypothetical protein
MRTRLSATLLMLMAACRADSPAWRARLAEPLVQSLKGSWTVVLERDGDAPAGSRRQVRGEIAITLNDGALEARGMSGRPLLFGSYDVQFDSLGFAGGATTDVPALAGTVVGDSVMLVLGPSSDEPVQLRGLPRGDSLTGRWQAHRRAGIDATGEFVMRRRAGAP